MSLDRNRPGSSSVGEREDAVGRGGATRPLVAVGLALLLAAAVVVGLAPGAAVAQDAPTGAGSAELTRQADALDAELASVQADEAASTEQLDAAQRAMTDLRAAYDRAVDGEDRAMADLRRYSVSAYVAGGVVDADLAASLLAAEHDDLVPESKRVLSVVIHGHLVGTAHDATAEADRLQGELDRTQAAADELTRHLADLGARHQSLAGEAATTRQAADGARRAEEAAEAERRRREAEAEADRQAAAMEAQLRAATPQPQSVHSGVVPSPAVRAEIIRALGGEIPQIALEAYWRAAGLTNGRRPDCGIDWALIAAIGRVETNHGRFRGSVVAPDGSTSPVILGIPLDGRSGTARIRDTDGGALDGDPVVDRAVGPMQFIPGTWRAFAQDGNGDGIADPHNIYDAAFATGMYLCSAAGGPIGDIDNASTAVYAYNRSTEYNIEVLTLADHFRRTVDPSIASTTVPRKPVDPSKLPPPASPDVPKPTDPGPDPSTTTTTTVPVDDSTTTSTTEPPSSTTTPP